jgi:hypothetical protein
MAARTQSRRKLREEHDQAEVIEQESAEADEPDGSDDEDAPDVKAKKPRARKAAAKKPAAAKAPAKPRARKRAAKVLPRVFAKWAVCDGALKRVAVFEYNQRADADARLAELRVEKKGPFFLQMVKIPFDPPVVEAVPAV